MVAEKIIDENALKSSDRKNIKQFYKRTLKALNDNKLKDAKVILYSEMPANLYDLSLDIQDNRNISFTDKGLRKLIKSVHSLLDTEDDHADEINDDNDNFGGFI